MTSRQRTYAARISLVRLRGLDRDEVRSFIAGLAHDLEGLEAQVATLTQENEALKHEN